MVYLIIAGQNALVYPKIIYPDIILLYPGSCEIGTGKIMSKELQKKLIVGRLEKLPHNALTQQAGHDKNRFLLTCAAASIRMSPDFSGAVAQLGARLHGMQKVEGSSPSGSSF